MLYYYHWYRQQQHYSNVEFSSIPDTSIVVVVVDIEDGDGWECCSVVVDVVADVQEQQGDEKPQLRQPGDREVLQ